MAVTNVSATAFGGIEPGAPLHAARIEIDPDASYPTGGYEFQALLEAAEPKLRGITWIMGKSVHIGDGTYFAKLDPVTQKILFYTSADGLQVAAATNLAAIDNVEIDLIGQ